MSPKRCKSANHQRKIGRFRNNAATNFLHWELLTIHLDIFVSKTDLQCHKENDQQSEPNTSRHESQTSGLYQRQQDGAYEGISGCPESKNKEKAEKRKEIYKIVIF